MLRLSCLSLLLLGTLGCSGGSSDSPESQTKGTSEVQASTGIAPEADSSGTSETQASTGIAPEADSSGKSETQASTASAPEADSSGTSAAQSSTSTSTEPETQPSTTSVSGVKVSLVEPRPELPGEVRGGEKMQPALLSGEISLTPAADKSLPTKVILTITNNQSHGVPLTYNSGMTADLWLLDPKGERVWAWSDDMMFTQAIRERVIAEGKTISVAFKIPAKAMSRVTKGYVLEVKFAGRATESSRPAMSPLYYAF